MYGDFSKWPLGGANIVGPLQQQGRVLLDTQQNAATIALRRWQDESARATFGHNIAAVPAWARDAFKLERAERKNDAGGTPQIFVTLDPGTIWADGILTQLDADPGASTATRVATYLTPPLGSVPADPSAAGTRDVVVLEIWRGAVSGFQDPDLLEPALGGPDTYELLETQFAFRLYRLGVDESCETVRERLQDDAAKLGKLSVTLAPTTVGNGDCPVVQGGGYAGFEHNLYRVEIAELPAGQPAMFKWSQVNGGLVGTGIFDASASPPTVTVIGNKSAIATSGLSDCYLEAFELDAQLGRWKLTYAAQATLGNDDVISLGTPSFGTLPGGTQPRFFRLWNGLRALADFPAGASPPVELRDGIRLQFDAAGASSVYRPGDYWTFPVRAGEIGNPQTLVDHRPPEGVRYHRVPLGVLRWTGSGPITAPAQIDDCRDPFHPLTGDDCCCTVSVGDGVHSQGDFTSIQAAIFALPPEGGRVCVLPGSYVENVLVQDRDHVILSGCGPHTVVRSKAPTGEFSVADPVIHVLGGRGIRIETMTLVADDTGVGVLLESHDGAKGEQAVPLHDVTVERLEVRAATASAIEMRSGTRVRICECDVLMKDVEGQWPGITVEGADIVIERNRVSVDVPCEPLRDSSGFGTVTASRVRVRSGANAGLGGIWLRGGSSFVRVLDNWIQYGVGNGITLGHAEVVQAPPGFNRFFLRVGWIYGAGTDCGPCQPGTTHFPPAGGGEGTQYVAGAPLEDIVIERNSITTMGLNGIGVFAFFGDPLRQGIITVAILRITDNQILGCLRRPLALTPDSSRGQVGYGGIALADVEEASISDNLIFRNGPDHLDPVCGIFIFHAIDVEIADNLIADNGARTRESARGARPGPRGGIWITVATERTGGTVVADGPATAPLGLPALRVHGNRVEAPLGRALTVEIAAGPISVVDNRLCTRGVAPTWDSRLAATVWIFDIAADRELIQRNNLRLMAAATGNSKLQVQPAARGSAILSVDGNVMFANNQVALEVVESQGRLISSILLISLDDLGFVGNQCDAFFAREGMLLTHVLGFGMSMRCNSNRLKEGQRQALFSALNVGYRGNLATGNVSTHCLMVVPTNNPFMLKTANVELNTLNGDCSGYANHLFTSGFVSEVG